MDILAILWQKGPSSVREVHGILNEQRDVVYTTTLKTMQVMTEKGMLSRNTDQRSHIYAPLIEKKLVEKNYVTLQGSTWSLTKEGFNSAANLYNQLTRQDE